MPEIDAARARAIHGYRRPGQHDHSAQYPRPTYATSCSTTARRGRVRTPFTGRGVHDPPCPPPPGISVLHACCADLNCGEAGLTTFGSRTIPPSALGSGKFVTPWARMHLAYFND